MASLFSYSLIVGLTLLPLYFIVRLGLGGCTFHSFNRRVIMACYIVALLLPLVAGLSLPDFMSGAGDINVTIQLPDEGMIVVSEGDVSSSPSWWAVMLILLYSVGLLFFLIREIIVWIKMLRLISSSERVRPDFPWKVYVHDSDGVAPFSWGRSIVLSRKDYSDGAEAILAHESVHLERRHTLDLLVAEAVAVLCWYNPAAWLMRDELSTVHEYETDEAVLSRGFDLRRYQMLLIKKAVGSRFPSIANSLDHSNLYKRIKMMMQKKSSPGRRWVAVAALPAVALCAVMLLTPGVASALDELSDTKVTDFSLTDKEALPSMQSEAIAGPDVASVSGDKVYDVAEKMPEYPGGEKALLNDIIMNMRYPQEAYKDSIEGRVVVRFVVKKDGTVGDISVLKGCNKYLDEEAVRVIGTLKPFTPGLVKGEPVSVEYALPVSFRLTKSKARDIDEDKLDRTVFSNVEQMPEFPGGIPALMDFLSKNLKYPEGASSGRVVVRFVVKRDGSVDKNRIEIVRSASPELDEEAIRVIKLLPDFKPGTIKGKTANVWYALPISFNISSQEK